MDKFINQNKWRIFLSLIYAGSLFGLFQVITGGVSLWWLTVALIWSKIIQLIGHSIGMHRYFSHKSFDTTPRYEKIMAWFSFLLGIGSPIQYARNHRFHHRVVDQPNDLHSPSNDGKIKTALGLWAFHDVDWFMRRGTEYVRDLITHPTYKFINNWYYTMWYSLMAISLIISWKILIFLVIMPSFIYHMELNIFVNCIGHSWGYRNFNTKDTSTNNQWVQTWTLGEGLHNNHHAHCHLYDFAVKKNEWDVSAWVIEKFMAVDGKHTRAGKIRIDN